MGTAAVVMKRESERQRKTKKQRERKRDYQRSTDIRQGRIRAG
jgi:hypothetical protein